MPKDTTGLNSGKAGPKGALAENPAGKAPPSGAPGAEGNNTWQDFVQRNKGKDKDHGGGESH